MKFTVSYLKQNVIKTGNPYNPPPPPSVSPTA